MVTLDMINVQNSNLLYSPAVLIDTTTMLTIKGSNFSNVTIYNSNLIVIKTASALSV